jgi:DNA processing protein
MYTLPGRWHAAALLSGQLDLSQAVLRAPGELHRLSQAQLEALGVRSDHARALSSMGPLVSPVPFLTLEDPAYPDGLRLVPFAPPVLFWTGNADLLGGGPHVAIVGARQCTGEGRRMAGSLARALAAVHGVVVSGLAHGIDTAAHMAAPSRTIAVLGHGLDVRRTQTASRTAETILASGGLLLSEFVPTYPASKHTFPQRNRVIAGMSALTVVVEAGKRSGASITARLALEAGRDVGAVPGSPYARASAGCLALLAQGAAIIRGPEDMLQLLGIEQQRQALPAASDDPIIQAIDPAGSSFDTLVDRLQMSPARLGAALGALELQGQIRRLPGDRFVLATSSFGRDPCAWGPSPGLE